MNNVCVQSLYVQVMTISMSPLPEGICCCLQTCNFVVTFMLMNNICAQSFNFIRGSMLKL